MKYSGLAMNGPMEGHYFTMDKPELTVSSFDPLRDPVHKDFVYKWKFGVWDSSKVIHEGDVL